MIVRILQALTEPELKEAKQLFKQHGSGTNFQESARASIIRPNLDRINKSLGSTQSNEHYLSIALQEALNDLGETKDSRPGKRDHDAPARQVHAQLRRRSGVQRKKTGR